MSFTESSCYQSTMSKHYLKCEDEIEIVIVCPQCNNSWYEMSNKVSKLTNQKISARSVLNKDI